MSTAARRVSGRASRQSAASADRHWALADEWRQVKKIRTCEQCREVTERGHVMHYSVAVAFGKFVHGYFCADEDCQDDYTYPDKPIGLPRWHRWLALHLVEDCRGSAA